MTRFGSLEPMKGALQILERALSTLVLELIPGAIPRDVSDKAGDLIAKLGAVPILPDERNERSERFGYAACICVNDVAANAVPPLAALRPGDLVTLDVALAWQADRQASSRRVIVDGATTCIVPGVAIEPRTLNLRNAARAATQACLASVEPGVTPATLRVIATSIAARFGVSLSEIPLIHRVGQGDERLHIALAETLPLQAGDVVAIEPLVIDGGAGALRPDPDGFTLRTAAGAHAAYEECTIVVGDDEATARILPPPDWRPWLGA